VTAVAAGRSSVVLSCGVGLVENRGDDGGVDGVEAAGEGVAVGFAVEYAAYGGGQVGPVVAAGEVVQVWREGVVGVLVAAGGSDDWGAWCPPFEVTDLQRVSRYGPVAEPHGSAMG
jgi:hypothetical protein